MQILKIIHDSHKEFYRNPFGAVKTGDTVRLYISVFNSKEPKQVFLRCWSENKENVVLMNKVFSNQDEFGYSVELKMPEKPQLFWYYFKVVCDGKTFYYSNNSHLGGLGEITENETLNSFQITVYDKNFKTPEWFYDSVMYQIFPDRFCRDLSVPAVKKREEYVIHQDWYEPLSDIKHPFENGPALCDFYGGYFKGIE